MQAIKRFMQQESSAALLLFGCAVLAFLLSNSPWQMHYLAWLQSPIQLHIRDWSFTFNLRLIINEGLMTAFFLVVGLEIKYELLAGALNTRAKAILPGIAAIGGMLIPAAIFIACTHGSNTLLRGWAIPTATDIAFSLGIMNLLGRHVNASLKIFLTTLAIFDDLAAITIIAIFYTSQLAWLYLSLGMVCVLLLYLAARKHIQALIIYCMLGAGLWVCLFKAGIHPTLSGILLAFVLPLHANSPAQRLKQLFHPWVPTLILPLFALANAGVSLSEFDFAAFPFALFWACILGLVIGKPLGVMLATWLAVRCRIGSLPAAVQWHEFFGMAGLCGIGFTVSLFIANLAFEGNAHALNAAKLGVLVGSLSCGLLGYAWLRFSKAMVNPLS